MNLVSVKESNWPTEDQIDTYKTQLTENQGRIFFECLPIVGLGLQFSDGTEISSHSLPTYCVEAIVSKKPMDDLTKALDELPLIIRRWYGYLNATFKTDLSWRATGLFTGVTYHDRYYADPTTTSTILRWSDLNMESPELSKQHLAALNRSIMSNYVKTFSLLEKVSLETPLDRAILSFGFSFGNQFVDEQFVSFWRVLECSTLHFGIAGKILKRVQTMLTSVNPKWTENQVRKWWKLRGDIVHDGINLERYKRCSEYIFDIHDCAGEVLENMLSVEIDRS